MGKVVTKTKFKPKPPFKRNPKHSADEFAKQLKDQEEAINKMTTKDWLTNRGNFKKRNKKDYNKKAKKARDDYRKQEIDRRTADNMLENGGDYTKAKQDAIDSMKGKAALHNPDGVAGGKIDDITGMGDSRVNSSLGSQWKDRAKSLEDQIKTDYGIPPKSIDDIPDGDMMNIDLF